MTLTSIITPTRNRRAFLQRAVASVLAQSVPDWELLIIDDASEDDTWDWLQTVTDARVRPLRLERPSERSVARNRGLAESRGEFCLFLDDDDYLYPHALEALVPSLIESPQAVACVGARLDVYNSTSVSYPQPKRRRELFIWPELIAGWMPAQGQYVLRTAVLQAVGGWSEQFDRAEDYDLWLRISRLGPVVCIPTVVMQATRAHPDKTPLSSVQRSREERWMEEFRHDFVMKLQGPERSLGERLLQARALWGEAVQAYQEGRPVAALSRYGRMYRCAPELFRSPILGPQLRLFLTKIVVSCILGRTGRQKFKGVITELERIVRRRVGHPSAP
ncbi:MAG: glycosyltransferase family 2 protein [Acidobacteria bacterium]|nr:glycosyltransferase family 2 protein [Acidobacteriota bacterium]MDW7984766.1 glycosyltransferase family A protein [Acidobacteriota bacterium]